MKARAWRGCGGGCGASADRGPVAITTAEHREFQVALEAALQRLPEGYRSVFLSREAESLRYQEIRVVLNSSIKTVSSRLHRARQQLRAIVQPRTEQ